MQYYSTRLRQASNVILQCTFQSIAVEQFIIIIGYFIVSIDRPRALLIQYNIKLRPVIQGTHVSMASQTATIKTVTTILRLNFHGIKSHGMMGLY